MKIKTKLANKNNYGNRRSVNNIKYIVIHYTGNDGDSDEGNANYFQGNRGVSAHYFVDDDSITMIVPDNYVAWAVGGNKYNDCLQTGGGKWYGKCTNNNSISIELCDSIKNGKYDFTDNTIKQATELTRELMQKYNIPISNVIRHFDVNGKKCPLPFVNSPSKWDDFKEMLSGKDEQLEMAVKKIINSGVLINYNAWCNVGNIKLNNVQALLNKLGGLERLVANKVISDKQLWLTGRYNANHIRALLIKYSKMLG